MQETPTEAVAIAEPNPHERLCGLIGAMKDGFVKQFNHEGLIIRQSGASVEVANENEEPLGGYMLIESASVAEVAEWVENKAEYYGGN